MTLSTLSILGGGLNHYATRTGTGKFEFRTLSYKENFTVNLRYAEI